MKKIICLIIISCLFTLASGAQMEHNMPMGDSSSKKPKGGIKMQMKNNSMKAKGDDTMHMNMDMGMSMNNMSHAFSLNLPMSRNGSGTGWMPDASPMYGIYVSFQKMDVHVHGNFLLRYNDQDFQ